MLKILLALPAIAIASAALADDTTGAATSFAKSAFVSLHSLPRPANDLDASLSYFANADAFVDFVRTTRATPLSGIASLADISVTYEFVPGSDAIKVGMNVPEGSTEIMFNAIQHVSAGGRSADNCFAVSTVVRSEPLGIRGLESGFSLAGMDTRPIPLADCRPVAK